MLAEAKTSAEVLAARDMASIAYTVAKKAAWMQKAKFARDDVVLACHDTMANAAAIEALAKAEFAKLYSEAQKRGEVGQAGRPKTVPDESGFVPATAAELGISRKEIFEGRMILEAEKADPGIVKRVLMEAAELGHEPSKAILREAVYKAHKNIRSLATGNDEWNSPAGLIEAARAVLGEIDLDPASNDVAQKIVQAKRYFTAETDGLAQEWHGRVWLNPPYSRELLKKFVPKLVSEVRAGRTVEAICIVNNCTEVGWFHEMFEVATALCFTKGRVAFYREPGTTGSPLQGSVIFYFGIRSSIFGRYFEERGCVLYRKLSIPAELIDAFEKAEGRQLTSHEELAEWLNSTDYAALAGWDQVKSA